jgi:hypothetical protein
MSQSTESNSRPYTDDNVNTYGSMLSGGYLINTLAQCALHNTPEPIPTPHVSVNIKLNYFNEVKGNIISLESNGFMVEYFKGTDRFETLIKNINQISLI